MEYLRLTNKDKTVTYVVVDQDKYSNRFWPFAVKVKKGSGRFESVSSYDSLDKAVKAIASQISCDPRLGFIE